MGLFSKLFKNKSNNNKKYKLGLNKTRESSIGNIKNVLLKNGKIDDELFYELEEIFISSDIGVDTVVKFVDELKNYVKDKNITNPLDLQEIIVDKMFDLYLKDEIVYTNLKFNPNGLTVFLFVGVNGVGKTTTIAKVANMLKKDGKKVLVAAGDTFRAGAIEQLQIWCDRVKVDLVKKEALSDPSSVIFDAIKKAKEENYDVVLCDTAGRLQNKKNLMDELSKIKRVIEREVENAPQETLLVIDATTGQNGMNQAKVFMETTDVSGIVLTKVDGTAKGGIVLAIRDELGIPIKLITMGEKIDDIDYFDIEQYIYGLFANLFDENDSR